MDEAQKPLPSLSAEFLAGGTARLDAIGPWVTSAERLALRIDWEAPAGLRPLWLPVGLRFQMIDDVKMATFDPDDRTFDLWDFYLSRQDEFAAHFRQLTQQDEVLKDGGEARRARVVVCRDLGLEEHRLTADFQFEGGSWATSYFYEHADAFWGFEC